ncbi:WD40 repeat domain-containing protein [Aspergillus clavatus NRRL 1]|uniref:60S ribosome biogenesis protein Sqt1, putative n=1 Tax=Aspergillus clavatus (strain ATCC 1007 / CBS 513.65 / DSM 816 / NCTC 3887 / NRRL 1 / QM 1276 / 107) TaxID=344612 RepID=A1CA72_ASPCL|nr:60S ribosome biogenesis protein Sqt1, putative [Aspergillus clavatus NRRL 1]EAW12640.1 60S ribosome biogenesis protein Sqt1, putative [Aspergillus clavatus NRRL 1]
MSSSQDPRHEADRDAYIEADEAEEIFNRDEDHPMESDPEDEDQAMFEQEITLQNDSCAHFDVHSDSVFCIAQHPIHNNIVITGSGDDTSYIFDSTPRDERPLLPQSYESNPQPKGERQSLTPIAKLDGHTDTVNAVTFTEPKGEYVVTAGLDGRLRAWRDTTPQLTGLAWEFVAESQEVEEINWVAVCPCRNDADEEKRNVVAIGASDGSTWVFRINHHDAAEPISMIQTFFQHTASCTAGAWTPDGNLLATVSEDGSFYVYDVWGAAAAAGISYSAGTSAVVGLTADDQRFAVEGGLYSIAISPGGGIAAVGGAEGHIRVIGLPRLTSAGGSKAKGASNQAASGASATGTIVAALQAQGDGIETLSFSSPPLTLLAAGSVDGSIALFDAAHRFAVRRHIRDAHEGAAVVKVEFLQTRLPIGASNRPAAPVTQGRPWLLTSVGMDGVVRRWDARGGTAAAANGLLKEWKGHFGLSETAEGEQSGGIMAFVQGFDGKRVVTAGDDGIALVFEE